MTVLREPGAILVKLYAAHLYTGTVCTDHSLFGFADAASILTNKLLAGALRNVDAVICVSHTGSVESAAHARELIWRRRENTVLRGELEHRLPGSEDRSVAYVIPYAIVPDQFLPPASPPPTDTSA